MLLSNREVLEAIASGDLIIEPFDIEPDGERSRLQPASIDLRLDPKIQVQSDKPIAGITLDAEKVDVNRLLSYYTEAQDISEGRPLNPGGFIIGQTIETVKIPLDMSGRVEGKSRLARLGVGVHITAPKIDPGFHNQITLEIYNMGPWTIELRAGMAICTLLIEKLGERADSGYQGIFQGRG